MQSIRLLKGDSKHRTQENYYVQDREGVSWERDLTGSGKISKIGSSFKNKEESISPRRMFSVKSFNAAQDWDR